MSSLIRNNIKVTFLGLNASWVKHPLSLFYRNNSWLRSRNLYLESMEMFLDIICSIITTHIETRRSGPLKLWFNRQLRYHTWLLSRWFINQLEFDTRFQKVERLRWVFFKSSDVFVASLIFSNLFYPCSL